jgi:hypothetical protein
MSPRQNWDSTKPSLASECAPPPGSKGEGAHSPAGEGFAESQFRRLEKGLALCILCGWHYTLYEYTLCTYRKRSRYVVIFNLSEMTTNRVTLNTGYMHYMPILNQAF